jgi:hypothetical protein
MLTKIAATTAFVSALASALSLFDVIDWSDAQIAGVNLVIIAGGTLVHSWFNPKIPLGVKE